MGMEKGSGLNFGPYDYNSGAGGGDIGTGAYNVKVIDYDGTIIAEKNLNDGDTFTLPKAPSHDGLVFQEWSATQEIVNGKITIGKSDVMIGAIYTTASGKNEFDIELNAVTGLSVTLNIDGNKDWGDGTTDDLTSHIYSQAGKYTIKTDGTTITSDSTSGIFGQTSSVSNKYCVGIRFATITTISAYAFAYCLNLRFVTLSNNITSLASNCFRNALSLGFFVIPPKITTLPTGVFQNSRIENIVFPYGLLTIDYYCFRTASYLEKVVLPTTITTVSYNVFQDCSKLKKIFISAGTIGQACFQYCSVCIEYNFLEAKNVPTINNTNVFQGINALCKMKVPSALYDSWIAATNWATYADYIVAV